jgi:hypothetical protein
MFDGHYPILIVRIVLPTLPCWLKSGIYSRKTN